MESHADSIKLNFILLRIVGGDSKDRIYAVTHRRNQHNLILIINFKGY